MIHKGRFIRLGDGKTSRDASIQAEALSRLDPVEVERSIGELAQRVSISGRRQEEELLTFSQTERSRLSGLGATALFEAFDKEAGIATV